MRVYRIIGNMTGNSMDAVDLVLTEFAGENMRDICSFSRPYKRDMQLKMENLRKAAYGKTAAEIEKLPEFADVHDEYVRQVADCVNEMCLQYGIDKSSVDAIGFHGKTIDHNPPSKCGVEKAYTVQIGSAKMLADLTGLTVVADFRSDALMCGLDGAPLAPPHNAKVAKIEGDGCYYNGGNTSNFAVIKNGNVVIAADAGPCNEYIDNYIRRKTDLAFDVDGRIGKKGKLLPELLEKIYAIGKDYYEQKLPKSGDPAYYKSSEIFKYIENGNWELADVVYTLEYFAAYIAVQALSLAATSIRLPKRLLLFGGGWKNPVVRQSLEDILNGNGYVMVQHKPSFEQLRKVLGEAPEIKMSALGDFMEARLFADLARCKLENIPWEVVAADGTGCKIVLGQVAEPNTNRQIYDDKISRAAKGWQEKR